MVQKSFFKTKDFPKEFGGELLRGRRKSKRPLATNKPVHNVLRADMKTQKSFLKSRNQVKSIIEAQARKFGIRVYRLGLARDHVHPLIQFAHREDHNGFVRALAGILAKLFKIQWLWRPFTRVVEWGRAFRDACRHVEQNELEGLGVIPYQPRKNATSPLQKVTFYGTKRVTAEPSCRSIL